ncbi:hypothetical protein FHS49_001735, partial [Sphingobium boeckii]|nr:hypothetical protein [Sphingobium boeckii]
AATTALRNTLRTDRGTIDVFDFGPTMENLRANCAEETGLPAPIQPKWAHNLNG